MVEHWPLKPGILSLIPRHLQAFQLHYYIVVCRVILSLEPGYESLGTRAWVREPGYERLGMRAWVREPEYESLGTRLSDTLLSMAIIMS